jgi:predicted aldo/keto reductase-like oxidoreductase
MTHRKNPNSGDEVSLLGYGMMRLPQKEGEEGAPFELDQERVNELVDYAIAHGVNYFDTAPRILPRPLREGHGYRPCATSTQ